MQLSQDEERIKQLALAKGRAGKSTYIVFFVFGIFFMGIAVYSNGMNLFTEEGDVVLVYFLALLFLFNAFWKKFEYDSYNLIKKLLADSDKT